MPIIVDSPKSQPAVTFNEVHVDKLSISITDGQVAKAKVQAIYRLFGRDEQGVKHFAPESHVIAIDDAFAEAAVKAKAGQPALAQALAGIEAAVAALVTEQGLHGTATVS